MAGGRRGDFRLQRFDGNRSIFALDAVKNFAKEFFGVGRRDPGGHGLNRHALWTHQLDLEAVRTEFLGDSFKSDDLPWRELNQDRKSTRLNSSHTVISYA